MPAKDHYQVLQITPAATPVEIKKAFRRLAQRYHPDKNGGDNAKTAFAAILTAYETLSDEKKRSAYNYERFAGKKGFSDACSYSAEDLLYNAEKIASFVQNNSIHTIDRDMLFFRWELLLSRDRICFDGGLDSVQLNRLLLSVRPSLEIVSYPTARQILMKIKALFLTGTDVEAIQNLSAQLRVKHYWNRYKMVVVLLAAMAVCIFIYLASA